MISQPPIAEHVIDLRSDTVTLPSLEMRQAMANAAVGDDFYGEDPTVRQLEERVAVETGKEAGLFVPSGTMGNLVAHLTHCPGGGEVVGPEPAHTFAAEVGGFARIAGLTVRTVPQTGGELDLDRFAGHIGPGSQLRDPTRLIWVEQPTRGFLVSLGDLRGLSKLAEQYGVPIHMDGARIFHAAARLNASVREIASHADSVMLCVSKGLGAPVGSLLVGSFEFITRARHNRQLLGGGMRQAGILAAAGLFGLDHGLEQLHRDHENARNLAIGLRGVPWLQLDRDEVATNIFYVSVNHDTMTADRLVTLLASDGILVNRPGVRPTVRFATHRGISAEDVEFVLGAVRAYD